jgi:hypothetical protein
MLTLFNATAAKTVVVYIGCLDTHHPRSHWYIVMSVTPKRCTAYNKEPELVCNSCKGDGICINLSKILHRRLTQWWTSQPTELVIRAEQLTFHYAYLKSGFMYHYYVNIFLILSIMPIWNLVLCITTM